MAEGGRGADDSEVLGRLPRSRPHRRSSKRESARTSAEQGPSQTPKPPRPRAKAKVAKPAVTKAAKPARAKAAKPTPGKAAVPAANAPTRQPRPRPQRPATTSPTASPRIAEPPRHRPGPPTGTDLLGTAVQAAGEIAQAGVTIGRLILKRAVSRLPRP